MRRSRRARVRRRALVDAAPRTDLGRPHEESRRRFFEEVGLSCHVLAFLEILGGSWSECVKYVLETKAARVKVSRVYAHISFACAHKRIASLLTRPR